MFKSLLSKTARLNRLNIFIKPRLKYNNLVFLDCSNYNFATAVKLAAQPKPKPSKLDTFESETPINYSEIAKVPVDEKHLWAHRFFPLNEKLSLPVFDFKTNSFTGENIAISHDIFNVPVRNDIIHRVYIYNKDYNRRTFKWVMSKGDVAGSNKKPFRQKKTGRAPQGDKRAPHLYHGGSAHGARPQQFYFPLNKRVRIFGLKSLLTSRLIQNKIIIINSEQLESNETKELKTLTSFLMRNPTLIVTADVPDKNFLSAKYKLNYINHIEADKLNVMKIMHNKFLMFTREGLESLHDLLKIRIKKCNAIKRKLDENKIKKENPVAKLASEFDFDPTQKIFLKTKILRNIYKDLRGVDETGDNPKVGFRKTKTKHTIMLERRKDRIKAKNEKKMTEKLKLKEAEELKLKEKKDKEKKQKQKVDTNKGDTSKGDTSKGDTSKGDTSKGDKAGNKDKKDKKEKKKGVEGKDVDTTNKKN